jgi:hypothetical protein
MVCLCLDSLPQSDNSDFMLAMEAEHFTYFGSQEEFDASLNKVTFKTGLCKEGKIAFEQSRELLHARKGLNIKQLISHPISDSSELQI